MDTHPRTDEPRRELDPYIVGAGFLDRLSEGVILINFEGKVPGKARTWVMVSTIPLTHEDGFKGLIATLDDVTILKHEEKSLRLLLEVSRLLTSVENESEFLQSLCDTLVEVGGYAIARLDCAMVDDEHSVKTMYIAEFTEHFTQSIYSWSDSTPEGQGPGGIAMRTRTTQVANDLSIYRGYEPWRTLVAEMGIASSMAIPLTLGSSTYVLGLYERYVGAFDEPTVRGLEEIAREIEFGSAHVRSVEETAAALRGTISALAHMTETRDPIRQAIRFTSAPSVRRSRSGWASSPNWLRSFAMVASSTT